MENKNKVYGIITDRIIKELEENNSLKWLKGWSNGLPKNLITKKSYNGINALLTMLIMDNRGYKTPYFLTFNQIQKLKGQLKKGSKAIPIVYYQINEYATKKDGQETIRKIPMLRYYSVFNVDDVTGIEIPKEEKLNFSPIERAEQIIQSYKDIPVVSYGGARAFYLPVEDKIQLPHKETFLSVEDFYSTFFHEIMHSTGHESRLKRELTGIQENKDSYSREEIIAELGNAFLCGISGIENNSTIKNNSAYIQSWIQALRQDNQYIFKVSREAQKGVKYITEQNKEQEQIKQDEVKQ